MERKLAVDGLHLVKLFEMTKMGGYNYYGAVMFTELGPGHYMAYCGTDNPNTVFSGVYDTNEAGLLAGKILSYNEEDSEVWSLIGGHGITFSDSELLEDVSLGGWWIGTDYQLWGRQGGSLEEAIKGCEGLRNLMWRSTMPYNTADAIAALKEYRAR